MSYMILILFLIPFLPFFSFFFEKEIEKFARTSANF